MNFKYVVQIFIRNVSDLIDFGFTYKKAGTFHDVVRKAFLFTVFKFSISIYICIVCIYFSPIIYFS